MPSRCSLISITIGFIFLILINNAHSAWMDKYVGTTSANFLKIGVGARPVAMGETFAAIADDANAIYWNPAGLSQIGRKELSAMHIEWFQEIKYEFLGYVHPLNSLSTIGGSLTYLHMDRIQKTEEDPYTGYVILGDFTAYDALLNLSYARLLSKNVSFGFNLKGIQEVIEEERAQGFAFDTGVLYRRSKLSLGAVLQNLGPEIKFIEEGFLPPASLKIGIAYRPSKDAVLAIDTNFPIDNKISIHSGGEVWLLDILALRAGYKYKIGGNELGDKSGLTAGLGLRFGGFQFDYAFVSYGDLGDTHRFSTLIKFGGPRKKPIEVKPPEAKPIIIDKEQALIHLNQGIEYLKKRLFDQAIAEFNKAIELNPKEAIIYYNYGLALIEQKKLDEATFKFKKAIELDPKFPEPHLKLGDIYFLKGMYREAMEEYRTFEKLLYLK